MLTQATSEPEMVRVRRPEQRKIAWERLLKTVWLVSRPFEGRYSFYKAFGKRKKGGTAGTSRP